MCGNCNQRSLVCTYEPEPRRRGPAKKKDGEKGEGEEEATGKDKDEDEVEVEEKTNRAGRRGRASGSGTRARRARHGSARPADGAEEMSASGSTPASLGQRASSSFPYTRSAFEPRLSGPMPSYPGLSYRPPSPSSSSYNVAPVAFTFLSVRPGPSRGAASVPESGQSSSASAPESTQSSTSNVSAPESVQSSTASSVPDSEDGAYEDMDYFDYDEFYDHRRSPRGRPSQ